MNSSFLSTFAATLFALVNPFGVLPVFISFSARERTGVQRFVALLISLTVLGLLLLFLTAGPSLLRFFGISLDSFRIAGGILLLLIGINLVLGTRGTTAKDKAAPDPLSDWQKAKSLYRAIVIPLAMPLLVGPGVIANVVLYAGEAETRHDDSLFVGMILVCAGVSFLNFVIFMSGRWLNHILGDVGLGIATRILGLLVASMGIQFVVTGITNVVVGQIAPQVMKLYH